MRVGFFERLLSILAPFEDRQGHRPERDVSGLEVRGGVAQVLDAVGGVRYTGRRDLEPEDYTARG